MSGFGFDLPRVSSGPDNYAESEVAQNVAAAKDHSTVNAASQSPADYEGLSIFKPISDIPTAETYDPPQRTAEARGRVLKLCLKIVAGAGVLVLSAGPDNLANAGQAVVGKIGSDIATSTEAPTKTTDEKPSLQAKPPKQKPQIITITPSPSPTEAALTEPEPSAEQQPPALKYLLNTIVFEGNALGHSHTAPGGKAEQMAGSQERTKKLVKLIKKLNVGVGGLQEFQQPQHDAFDKLAGDDYGLWPNKSEDVVFWDKAQFEKIGEDTFNAPYFDGNTRQYPIVKLQDKTTGQKFFAISVHWPADTRQFTDQERFREQAANRLITVIVRLSKSGLPVIVVGDLNERKDGDGFCDVDVPGTGIESANGGSNIGGNCKEPTKKIAVDWIFGTSDIDYSDYEPHAKPAMTDHRNVFSARVTLANTTR